jgi:uncharacterized protein YbaR (Trm112 family)
MQSWLLDFLRCPACRDGRVDLERRDVVDTLAIEGAPAGDVLVEGVLRCASCGGRFPVLDESPRMLPVDGLDPDERAVLAAPRHAATTPRPALQLSADEVQRRVRERILADYHNPTSGPPLRRAQADLDYQLRYEDSRVYQMQFLARRLGATQSLVVDVGGGRGGNLNAARREFRFEHGIVIDRDRHWPALYRTGDRTLAYVRADATRLPLRNDCASMAISSFLLEHVQEWQSVVREIERITRVAFVAFGPNPAFPYEFGHVDAPLAHTLPAPIGAFAALLWDQVSGNRRTYRRLREIIDDMHWVSSRRYYAFCREQGLDCENLFVPLITAWCTRGGTGWRARLARRPAMIGALARTLSLLRMEPNVYSLLRRPQ